MIGRNNCYNYAVKAAVRADRLLNLVAVPNGRLPGDGWPVALFIKPGGTDVHFYRQDKNGRWSHKPGGWPVRACDEDGAPILSDDDALIASL